MKKTFCTITCLFIMAAFETTVHAATWVNGSNIINQAGVYGTKGEAASDNMPGSRSYCVSFKDGQNNLWLFGGLGIDAYDNYDLMNDLWKFDGTNWTWVGGSDMVDIYGTYGTKGAAAPGNMPGSRESSISWIDASGNFWLFGGFGLGASGDFGYLNDLWKFDGANWTWVSGSSGINQNGSYGSKGSPSPANIPGCRECSISWIDASGNLWLFGGHGFSASGSSAGLLNDLWKFDGTNWTWVSGSDSLNQYGVYGAKGVATGSNIPGARDTSVSWVDGLGNLWLFGGLGYYSTGSAGSLNDLWKFDGANWTWMGGSNITGQLGVYGTMGVPDANNMPGARNSGAAWTDGGGNFWLFGGSGRDSFGSWGYLNDLWKFDGTNWVWVNGSNSVNQNGIYGAKGTPAATNVPGAREGSIPWLDRNGNLWLFGGYGLGATGSTEGYLNDLWKLAAGVAPAPQANYIVGAYYYPWYNNDNFHTGTPAGSDTLIYHLDPSMMPQLGWYNQTQPSVISQHFKWARYAGISFFVTSYWGQGGGEDNTIKTMFDNPDRGNIKLAVFFEPVITLANVAAETSYLCDNYFNRPGGYLQIDDKPVIFIYVTRAMGIDDLTTYINTIRTAASDKGTQVYIVGDEVYGSLNTDLETPRVPLLDAVTNYDVYGSLGRPRFVGDTILQNWQANNTAWKNFVNGFGKQFIPAVAPGFNDRGVRLADNHPACSRKINTEADEFGSLFSAMLDRAKLSIDSKKILMVTSWNEWHEDTQIEPVKYAPRTSSDDSSTTGNYTQGLNYNGYGMLYLQILRNKVTSLALCDYDNDGNVNFADLAIICGQDWLDTCTAGFNCWGDINNSGQIDFADFARCAESWGQSLIPPPPSSPSCDFNNDGQVGFDDLAYLVGYWLYKDCSTDVNCLKADLITNNNVDLFDFSICAQSWTGQ